MGSWLSTFLETDVDAIIIDFPLNNVNKMKQNIDKNKAGMAGWILSFLKERPGASHFLCHP